MNIHSIFFYSYTHIYLYMCVAIYICTYIYIDTYILTYIYIYNLHIWHLHNLISFHTVLNFKSKFIFPLLLSVLSKHIVQKTQHTTNRVIFNILLLDVKLEFSRNIKEKFMWK